MLYKTKIMLCGNYEVGTFSSVQLSPSVVSDSLQPHESQHARPPYPSPTPVVHSNWRPLSRWCHPAISSSVIPFSSCPQFLPALESFPMSQLFAWGGQSTGVSALTSFLPKNTQGWSPLELTGWISLQSKGLSLKSLLQHHIKLDLKNSTFNQKMYYSLISVKPNCAQIIKTNLWLPKGKCLGEG